MNLKRLTAITLALASVTTPSHGFVTMLSADSIIPDAGFTDSNGAPLTNAAGSISFGFFTADGTVSGEVMDNATITGIGEDPLALQSKFVSLGSSTDFDAFSIDGLFTGRFEISDSMGSGGTIPHLDYTTHVAGQSVYALVFGDNEPTGESDFGVFQSVSIFNTGNDAFSADTLASFKADNVTPLFGSTDGVPVVESGGASLQLQSAGGEAPSAYDAWAVAFGNPAPDSDLDADGITAINEFFYGGDPTVASHRISGEAPLLPTVVQEPDGALRIGWNRRGGPLGADVTYTIQFSRTGEPGSWIDANTPGEPWTATGEIQVGDAISPPSGGTFNAVSVATSAPAEIGTRLLARIQAND